MCNRFVFTSVITSVRIIKLFKTNSYTGYANDGCIFKDILEFSDL